MPKPAQIGVLDCNNFFVSCERLFRPDLRKKPVAVLSSNDGCIVARSQEVKDIGIPMGVPYFQIKDIIHKEKITVFSSHFALYRDISRRVFEVLRTHLEHVEQYSVDEAFFIVPEDIDAEELALDLKDSVEREVGVPVSVGIGFSKTQAKTAVERAKKNRGVFVWNEDSWMSASSSIRLAEIWGVGAQLELRYKKHDLITVDDLLRADPARIQKLFGVGGIRLQNELRGKAVESVAVRPRRQHSIMSSRSFKQTSTDKEVVADAVAYHVRQIAESLREMQAGTSELRVSIRPSRHSDFVLQGGSAAAILPVPTNDTVELLKVASGLLERLFQVGVPYKKAGVVAVGLVSEPTTQQTLFGETPAQERGRLMQIIDQINLRSGKETLTIGNRLRAKDWGAKVDVRSPAYTTKWQDVAQVKA